MEQYVIYTILLIALIIDIKTMKIPNKLVLVATIIGLIFSIYASGWMGLLYSIVGMIIVFLILLPIWLIRVMGAGDIKLLMAISTFPLIFINEQAGFFTSVVSTLSIGYYSVIIAGIMYLFVIPPKQIIKLFNDFFCLIFYKIPLLSKEEGKKVQFSISIFIAFILFTQNILP